MTNKSAHDKAHKIDLKQLSLPHLESRITGLRLLEEATKKPRSVNLAYRQAREAAVAELERRNEAATDGGRCRP